MAETLEGYEFPDRRGTPKYDWDTWTDGQTWRLTEGVDFENVNGLRVSIYKKATSLGRKARTRITVIPNPSGEGPPLRVVTVRFEPPAATA